MIQPSGAAGGTGIPEESRFVYNADVPGVMEVTLKALMEPAEAANVLTTEAVLGLSSIEGSTLRWGAATACRKASPCRWEGASCRP
jgi:hypothetical protein